MGRKRRRLLAAAAAALAPRGRALSCYEGRVHDHDMHTNDQHVALTDTSVATACPAERSACCLRFEASRCCNLKGRTFAVSDGRCGNATECADAGWRADVCAAYESPSPAAGLSYDKHSRCAHATCDTDDCNVLGLFKSCAARNNCADGAAPRAAFSAAALAFVGLGALWAAF
mmetsp:Transcript_9595/g.28707  ORF Transcript_9595/g.28707 Transcript_9595/m.28707 type:complete len:173 (+) Transcript_9595:260-778(+)